MLKVLNKTKYTKHIWNNIYIRQKQNSQLSTDTLGKISGFFQILIYRYFFLRFFFNFHLSKISKISKSIRYFWTTGNFTVALQ